MKTVRYFLLSLFLVGTSVAFAANDSINQERLMVTSHNLMIVSSFTNEDHVTAYNDYGTLLWDVTFRTQVVSWKLKDGDLYVFTKSRYKDSTYLTCIDPVTGTIIWERP